eukprot:806704-Prymnesium_polylepis.1
MEWTRSEATIAMEVSMMKRFYRACGAARRGTRPTACGSSNSTHSRSSSNSTHSVRRRALEGRVLPRAGRGPD